MNEQNNYIKHLEHVQLYVTIEYSRRGDLHLNLTSPDGILKNFLIFIIEENMLFM